MKTGNKITAIISIVLITFILFTSIISAFAVSAPYMGEEKQLKLYPGQETNLEFILQNGVGPDDITIKANVIEGSEIIQITDTQDTYFVPVGEKVKVNVKVLIPTGAVIGEVYPVKIGFGTATKSESGTFAFGSNIEQSFDVVVGEKIAPAPSPEAEKAKPAQQFTFLYYLMGLIIIIALTVFFMIQKRKQATQATPIVKTKEKTSAAKSR